MGIDAIIAIFGLVFPPVVDFVKKKWLKPNVDTPEATLSTLATTKPEVMAPYITAQTGLLDAKTKFFNRDVCGVPAQWVINLRASIRPVGVIIAFCILIGLAFAYFNDLKVNPETKPVIEGVRFACIAVISSWFGDRLSDME